MLKRPPSVLHFAADDEDENKNDSREDPYDIYIHKVKSIEMSRADVTQEFLNSDDDDNDDQQQQKQQPYRFWLDKATASPTNN